MVPAARVVAVGLAFGAAGLLGVLALDGTGLADAVPEPAGHPGAVLFPGTILLSIGLALGTLRLFDQLDRESALWILFLVPTGFALAWLGVMGLFLAGGGAEH